MSMLVHDCPRCGARRTTFDVRAAQFIDIEYDWKKTVEIFCTCRHCIRSTTFIVSDKDYNLAAYVDKQGGLPGVNGTINEFIKVLGHVSIKDEISVSSPEHVPSGIKAIFDEGAACKAIRCYNASGAMFRLCIDLTTKSLLPQEQNDDDKALKHARKFLHARLEWLFGNHMLPQSLRELANCVREDGNDGAHDGTLTEPEAEDLCDFTMEILETVYTAPTRLELAKERRTARRGGVE